MANEEYLEMIELPVSTCEMVIEPKKRKFKRSKLIKKLNKKIDESAAANEKPAESAEDVEASKVVLYEKKQKKQIKFDIVAVQVVAIFALVVAIILTNVFWEQSGINTLVRSVFKTEKVVTDERAYTAFKITLPAKADNVTISGGVMTVGENVAVYSPADGTVTDVYSKNGVYTVTVNHSDRFKSVISGLDHAYVDKGDKVYGGIPVGYIGSAECKIAMYQDDSLIKNYSIDGGTIVWEN